jgi:hypothetical protein
MHNNQYDPNKLRLMVYNYAISSNVIQSLLNIATRTQEIILIQNPWI